MHDQIPETRDSWKFTDAKARLSEVVQRALDGKPQRIVRGGRDVVVVVAEAQFKRAGKRADLVHLFSALRGTGLHLERERDTGREPEL